MRALGKCGRGGAVWLAEAALDATRALAVAPARAAATAASFPILRVRVVMAFTLAPWPGGSEYAEAGAEYARLIPDPI